MKKEAIISLSLISLIILSSFVYAAGNSGSSNSQNTQSSNSQTNATQVNCEDKETVRERVKCRLQNGVESNYQTRLHESCRNLNNQSRENCRRLYQEIQECYSKEGREKDRCFKLKTGFATSAVSGQGINKEAARNYLVTLLYDLEERIEEKQGEGIITAEQGAELIAKIIEIKEKIMQQANGSEIRPLIRELKQVWRQAFNPTPAPTNTTINSTQNTT